MLAMLVGLASLGGLLLISLVLGFICCRILRKRQEAANLGKEDMVVVGQDAKTNSSGHQHVIGSAEVMKSSNPAQVFSYEDVEAATNNFSRKLGQGGFGPVYFGKLSSGASVAIKVLSDNSHQGVQEFLNEVSLLSRVHHRNLVNLIGYCIERKLVLVYEYLSNGNLQQWLQGDTSQSLPWKERVKIAVDAAQGLNYLHKGCNPPIIHRDVKTSNILLNDNMEGKISDFGISRLAHDELNLNSFTNVKGSYGYIDPEYFKTHCVSDKTDIYSFGVVLLEIISGRPPINLDFPDRHRHLTDWVKYHVQRGSIENIADQRLGSKYNLSSMWKAVETAMMCVVAEVEMRPTIGEVCAELNDVLREECQDDRIYESSMSASYCEASRYMDLAPR